jgi:hypothetical protein
MQRQGGQLPFWTYCLKNVRCLGSTKKHFFVFFLFSGKKNSECIFVTALCGSVCVSSLTFSLIIFFPLLALLSQVGKWFPFEKKFAVPDKALVQILPSQWPDKVGLGPGRA